MSKTSTTRDDFTTLKREVTELQESRKQIDLADTKESEAINDCEPVTETAEGVDPLPAAVGPLVGAIVKGVLSSSKKEKKTASD